MNAKNRGEKHLMAALLLWLAYAPLAQAFYNPSTGRWLSRDPIAEKGHRIFASTAAADTTKRRRDLNCFGFVGNSPTFNIDVLGLYTEEERKKVCDDFEKTFPERSRVENKGGTVVCKGGVAYPCLFGGKTKSMAPEIAACYLAHEESHTKDPNLDFKTRCTTDPGIPTFANKKLSVAGECEAYRVMFDCLNKFTASDPKPAGWLTGIADIERYLKQNPGGCAKQFPDDRLPW